MDNSREGKSEVCARRGVALSTNQGYILYEQSAVCE